MADILFLCQRLPFPPNKGEKIRAFHILRHLSRQHHIHLACFIDNDNDWAFADSVRAYCVQSHFEPLNATWARIRSTQAFLKDAPLSSSYYWSARLYEWIKTTSVQVQFQSVFVYSSVMAQFVSACSSPPSSLVLDYVDVDSDKWRQYAETKPWPLSWIYRREANKLLDFDRDHAGTATACVFVSDSEVRLFNQLAPEVASKSCAIENGVDSDFFAPNVVEPFLSNKSGPVLTFTGTMDYWPNEDAVTWFAKYVLPLIRASRGDVEFYVVGARPSSRVRALEAVAGVHVTGAVDDVRPYLIGADAIVTPLRLARGMQNKVLEGMASGKPVVTTPQGLEGILARHGKEVLVADSAEDFARTVLRALEPGLAKELGRAARQCVLDQYTWDSKLEKFDRLLAL